MKNDEEKGNLPAGSGDLPADYVPKTRPRRGAPVEQDSSPTYYTVAAHIFEVDPRDRNRPYAAWENKEIRNESLSGLLKDLNSEESQPSHPSLIAVDFPVGDIPVVCRGNSVGEIFQALGIRYPEENKNTPPVQQITAQQPVAASRLTTIVEGDNEEQQINNENSQRQEDSSPVTSRSPGKK